MSTLFRSRSRPTKPEAILGIAVGAGMIAFALVFFRDFSPIFLGLWCVLVVAISGFNVWAAFSTRPDADAPPSLPRQLEQLSRLHRKGRINDVEYAEAKRKLLR